MNAHPVLIAAIALSAWAGTASAQPIEAARIKDHVRILSGNAFERL